MEELKELWSLSFYTFNVPRFYFLIRTADAAQLFLGQFGFWYRITKWRNIPKKKGTAFEQSPSQEFQGTWRNNMTASLLSSFFFFFFLQISQEPWFIAPREHLDNKVATGYFSFCFLYRIWNQVGKPSARLNLFFFLFHVKTLQPKACSFVC